MLPRPSVALSSPPVMTCGIIVVVSLPDVVMFPVMSVSFPVPVVVVVVSFSASLVVIVSPVSKIKVAIEPIAENVPPLVAFVVVSAVVAFVVVVPVVALLLVALVSVALMPIVAFCATAGARLNAAAKSPKTSISAIAIGAFFIAQNVQE